MIDANQAKQNVLDYESEIIKKWDRIITEFLDEMYEDITKSSRIGKNTCIYSSLKVKSLYSDYTDIESLILRKDIISRMKKLGYTVNLESSMSKVTISW